MEELFEGREEFEDDEEEPLFADDLDDPPPLPPPMPSLSSSSQQQHSPTGDSAPDGEAPPPSVAPQSNDQGPPLKKRKPLLTLTTDRIFSEKGLPYLEKEFPKLKFRGKGHESSDLKFLLKQYEMWANRLYPKYTFKDVMQRIERLSTTKEFKNQLLTMRRRYGPGPAGQAASNHTNTGSSSTEPHTNGTPPLSSPLSGTPPPKMTDASPLSGTPPPKMTDASPLSGTPPPKMTDASPLSGTMMDASSPLSPLKITDASLLSGTPPLKIMDASLFSGTPPPIEMTCHDEDPLTLSSEATSTTNERTSPPLDKEGTSPPPSFNSTPPREVTPLLSETMPGQ